MKRLSRIIVTNLSQIEFKADPEVVNLTEIQRQMPIIDWKRLIDSWIPNGYAHLKEKVYGFNTSYYEEVKHNFLKISNSFFFSDKCDHLIYTF